MSKAAKRHWTPTDFTVTTTSPDYAGGPVLNKFGYCRVCKGDMQQFSGGHVLHYNSHQTARRLGLDWQRRAS